MTKSIKRGLLIILIAGSFTPFLISFVQKTYETIVLLEESVYTEWKQVERLHNLYVDLIPTVASVIKKHSDVPADTRKMITALDYTRYTIIEQYRSGVGTSAAVLQLHEAYTAAVSDMDQFILFGYDFDSLKTDKLFLSLCTISKRTANRMNDKQNEYNTAAKTYNEYITVFPYSFVAVFFGFRKYAYFPQNTEHTVSLPTE